MRNWPPHSCLQGEVYTLKHNPSTTTSGRRSPLSSSSVVATTSPNPPSSSSSATTRWRNSTIKSSQTLTSDSNWTKLHPSFFPSLYTITLLDKIFPNFSNKSYSPVLSMDSAKFLTNIFPLPLFLKLGSRCDHMTLITFPKR